MRTLRVFGLLGSVALAAGCDHEPAPSDLLAGAAPEARFQVISARVGPGERSAAEEIVVRLSAPVDPATAGIRSVRLLRADGRRPLRTQVRVEGSTVRLIPDRPFGASEGTHLTLRIEGAPSPRALRSRTGAPLAEHFETEVRLLPAAVADLEGPELVGSSPADGAADAAPPTAVELRFSEPVDLGAVRTGDAVTVRVDGVEVPARLRASADGRRLLARLSGPVRPGAAVEVEVHPCLLDRAGNPLRAGSRRHLAFRTRASSLHEIVEEFVCDDMADAEGTDCAWGEPSNPGFLVPRCRATPLNGGSGPFLNADLGDREVLRFLLLVHGDPDSATLASGLRVRFAQTPPEGPLLAATIDGGDYALESLEPSLDASRRNARLVRLADGEGPFASEPDTAGGATVEIPFAEPLRLAPGAEHLLDIALRPAQGARVAAAPASTRRTLVEGGAPDRLGPAADLLVAAASPGALSRWYDAGVARPRWGTAQRTLDAEDLGIAVTVEFQTAPAAGPGGAGGPDEELASAWDRDLARLPPDRFVRFRVRFEGTALGDRPPRVDRVVMPYVAETP